MRWGIAFLSYLYGVCSLLASVDSVLNPTAEWSLLDPFQGTLSCEAFEQAMDGVYAPNADWRQWIHVEPNGAWIERGERPGGELYWMAFAESADGGESLEPPSLRGLRIALDPGHIGGEWGVVEERSFRVGDKPTVREGDLVLAASRRVAKRLSELGAAVRLTRSNAEPVTQFRVEDFLEEAGRRLADSKLGGEAFESAQRELAERLFYRTAEIRARAEALRDWKPDIAVALHINASAVEEDSGPLPLTEENDMHILVNGCYLPGELADPTQRCEMLWRLFNRYHREEFELAFAMKRAMRESIALPRYEYVSDNAHALDVEKYIYARNLLANRIFDCPVVYLEPWQLNSEDVYPWAAAGDYEGTRFVAGELRRSLPAVYADFVVQGLRYRYGGE